MSTSQPSHAGKDTAREGEAAGAFDLLWDAQEDILKPYLEAQSDLTILFLDLDKHILAGNQGFVRLLGGPFEKGQPLMDHLLPESSEALNQFPDPGEVRRLRLNLTARPSGVQTVICRVYNTSGGYTVFGEKHLPFQSDVINQLAEVNNQLTNLSRELAQKNRALEKANATITRLMRTDPLTELANRRFFQERLSTALASAKRHETPLSLVMADLDHFKRINDTWGHAAGDAVLKGFADILQSACRIEDQAARFGGEEFIVMLSHTDREGAAQYAERVRRELEVQTFPEIEQRVTASFGVSQLKAEEDAESFIQRADKALYRAKSDGRNRVVML
ncbi:MAG: GGDEF domain-containing protein [Deltaproteobacteria bacterium]